jgi:hypothetical protein
VGGYIGILILAIDNNNMEILKLLLTDNKFDPSYERCFAFFRAYKTRNINAIQLLWKNKKVRKFVQEKHLDIYNCFNKKFITHKINKF